jgi:hypothetical protein
MDGGEATTITIKGIRDKVSRFGRFIRMKSFRTLAQILATTTQILLGYGLASA